MMTGSPALKCLIDRLIACEHRIESPEYHAPDR